MPTYEYACRDCGRNLEVVQSFKDDPLDTCEHCGGSLRKVFSAAGIIFKGSGYYVTDSRSERRRAASGASASDGASDESSATSKDSADTKASSSDASSSDSSSSAGAKSGTKASADAKSA